MGGDARQERIWPKMEQAAGKAPRAVLALSSDQVDAGSHVAAVDGFVGRLSTADL